MGIVSCDMVAPYSEALQTVVGSHCMIRADAESSATEMIITPKADQPPNQSALLEYSALIEDLAPASTLLVQPPIEAQCGYYRHDASGFCDTTLPVVEPPSPAPPCGWYRHSCDGFAEAAVGEGEASSSNREKTVSTSTAPEVRVPRGGLSGAHRQVAQDGTVFETEAACKQYTYQNFHCFKNRTDEKLVRGPGELKGMSFDLDSLVDCEVLLLDVVGQVLADDLVRCHVFIGACTHDIFLRNCRDCTFTIAGKQLRTRDCTDCVLYTYSMTRPVVELSSGLRFRNFNGAYPRLGAHFRRAKLDPDINKWGTIHDFSKNDATLPKPHFVIETEHDGETWEVSHPKMKGKPVNPAISGLARCQSATSVLTSSNNKKKTGNKKGFAGMGMALGRSFTFNC